MSDKKPGTFDDYFRALGGLTTFAKDLERIEVIREPDGAEGKEVRRFVAYLPPEKVAEYKRLRRELEECFARSPYERRPVLHVWPENIGDAEQINVSFTDAKAVYRLAPGAKGQPEELPLCEVADLGAIEVTTKALEKAGIGYIEKDKGKSLEDLTTTISVDVGDIMCKTNADGIIAHVITGLRYTARVVYADKTVQASAGILLTTNKHCRVVMSPPRRRRPGKGAQVGVKEINLITLPAGAKRLARFFIEGAA